VDVIKWDEMNKGMDAMRNVEKRRDDRMGDLGIDVMLMLIWILNEWNMKVCVEDSCSPG
jgi:hypothetical protein